MDILSDYERTKKAIQEVQKKLFELLEANDTYKIIKTSDLAFLDFTDSRNNETMISINLYAYHEVAPRVVFDVPREIALACDSAIVKIWHNVSKDIVDRTNATKLRKFFKDFPEVDHRLIHLAVTNYPKMAAAGMSDNKIAEKVAKGLSFLLEKDAKNGLLKLEDDV